jgi:hypothetical protein
MAAASAGLMIRTNGMPKAKYFDAVHKFLYFDWMYIPQRT